MPARTVKFAICNELFEGWEYPQIVRYVSDTGYDGLEIAPFTFAESVDQIYSTRRNEIKMIAIDHGIEITGLHWLLVKPEGLHVCHTDVRTRERTIDYLRKLIDFCADIGGTVMTFGSPNQRNLAPGVDRNQGWQWAMESFAACGPVAASRGVTVCLEALPQDLTNLLNTNAEVIEMVRAINHSNIRMMVDVKSMCAEQMSIPENIRNCTGYFRHVHANDANLKGPGFGDVDFRPILQALIDVDYHGFVSIEAFDFSPGPEETARKGLRYLKDCLNPV